MVKISRPVYKVAFNTRLDTEVYEALSKENHDSGVPMTAIVDAALRKYLKLGKEKQS